MEDIRRRRGKKKEKRKNIGINCLVDDKVLNSSPGEEQIKRKVPGSRFNTRMEALLDRYTTVQYIVCTNEDGERATQHDMSPWRGSTKNRPLNCNKSRPGRDTK